MKYVVVSINPGVDEFRYYGTKEDALSGKEPIRIERKSGSKGANCAIALAALGASVDYFTVGRGEYGVDGYFSEYADKITVKRTVTDAPERVNVKLIYPEDGGIRGMTEQNSRGGPLTAAEADAFFDSIVSYANKEKRSGRFSTYVFTGSLPQNVEKEKYLRCISEISRLGAFTVLDGRGELISRISQNFPSLIKPNLNEWHELCMHVEFLKSFPQSVEKSEKFSTEMLKSARKLVEKWKTAVLLTLGERGFCYADDEMNDFIFESEPRDLLFPAGMGDNLLSAFLYYTQSEGLSPMDAARRAEEYAVSYGLTGISGGSVKS